MSEFENIIFERSGGMTGIPVKGTLLKRLLNKEEYLLLTRLLDESDFFRISGIKKPDERGPDRFHYTVTVETEHKKFTVSLPEDDLSQGMRSLVNFLSRKVIRLAGNK